MAKGRRDLQRPVSGLILLVSALLLPLLTNLLSSWLERLFGQTPSRLFQLAAIVLAAAAGLGLLALLLRERRNPVVVVPRDAQPRRYAGLIALVGKRPPDLEPAVTALEYHLGGDGGLKVCWLVASAGAEGSVPAANEIARRYASRCTVHVCEAGDGFGVQDVYDVVQRIYNQDLYLPEHRPYQLTPEQVICDFTAGTAPMTAGMVLACAQYRPMQYTVGRRGAAGPDIASMPLLVQFRPTPRRRGRP